MEEEIVAMSVIIRKHIYLVPLVFVVVPILKGGRLVRSNDLDRLESVGASKSCLIHGLSKDTRVIHCLFHLVPDCHGTVR